MHIKQIWEKLGRLTNTLIVGKKNENMQVNHLISPIVSKIE
jgi:hypothetical protein